MQCGEKAHLQRHVVTQRALGSGRQQTVREAGMADGASQIAERLHDALEAPPRLVCRGCRRRLPAVC
jgi:hypothetical protein